MVRVYRKDLETFYEVSEERAIELEQVGYSRDPSVAGTDFGGSDMSAVQETQRQETEGYQIGQAMFAFLPESVLNAFAK